MAGRHFRAGVVIVVRRDDGRVMAFERVDMPDQWQLPQGGLERDERPVAAAWRELAEETGMGPADVALVGEHPEWTVYEWPADVVRGDARLGQAHRWFFFRPLREDIEPSPDGREFGAWKWVEPGWLIEQVVEFRREPYQRVLGVGDG